MPALSTPPTFDYLQQLDGQPHEVEAAAELWEALQPSQLPAGHWRALLRQASPGVRWAVLIELATQNEIAGAQALLTDCPRVNPHALQMGNSLHPLTRAAELNHLEMLKLLLDSGFSARVDQSMPLHLAAGQGHLEAVQLLLPVSNLKEDGGLIFAFAANNGRTEVVDAMWSHVDPFALNALAFLWALKARHLAIAERFVEAQNPELPQMFVRSMVDGPLNDWPKWDAHLVTLPEPWQDLIWSWAPDPQHLPKLAVLRDERAAARHRETHLTRMGPRPHATSRRRRS